MFLIDTNILSYFVLEKYQDQDKILALIDYYSTIPIHERLVTDFILCEFQILMDKIVPKRYKLKGNEILSLNKGVKNIIKMIVDNYPFLRVEHKELVTACDIFNKSQNLSYTDSLLISIALNRDYQILTADKKLIKVAKKFNINGNL